MIGMGFAATGAGGALMRSEREEALEQKNAALEKQHAAMSQMIQLLTSQNARLAAANVEGSAVLKDTVQQLGSGQNAMAERVEFLEQKAILLEAKLEGAYAQHGDEVSQKDSQIAEQATTIQWQNKKIEILESAFSVMESVRSTNVIKQCWRTKPVAIVFYSDKEVEDYFSHDPKIILEIMEEVESTKQKLIDLLKMRNENSDL
jgi:predicted nucleic acid-binding protein